VTTSTTTTTTFTTTTTTFTTTTTTRAPVILGVPVQTDLCRDIVCGANCEWIFARVMTSPGITGGTRIEWTIHPQFDGEAPYTYQVQVGRTGNPLADDWVDIGGEISDTYYMDLIQRVYGKFNWTHYRVILTTADGYRYASKPQPTHGRLTKSDWLRAREIKRLELLRLQKEAGAVGYLLKRRLFGESCSCLDELTGEIRNPQCGSCYGTGFVGGYFDPYPCFYVEMGLNQHRTHSDDSRGTVNDLPVILGRMINDPQIFSYDVFVEADTDLRWCLHRIKSVVEIRGLPLILQVEMRQLPFSDPAYLFSLV
jgi:hypothetical protein